MKIPNLIIYTGPGKGKTTAALGLALKYAVRGKKVKIIQYLKGSTYSGELYSSRLYYPHLEIYQFGYGCPWSSMIKSGFLKCRSCGECFRRNRDPKEGYAQTAWTFTKEIITNSHTQLLVLDEFNHAVRYGFIPHEEIRETFTHIPSPLTVICTGRNAPRDLVDLAGKVMVFEAAKHPYQAGISSRRGIEY
ncbi:MAG: cob(I)yrinic acid a,c-diamide adenosyltransferase [Peptococcaceae bacterium]|jgi:cob(I)alamin adenosyltransferase|nr:cob(I)yrinic acid a,c-diamide adenosyltransferase [Peptococcaceae bacterium]